MRERRRLLTFLNYNVFYWILQQPVAGFDSFDDGIVDEGGREGEDRATIVFGWEFDDLVMVMAAVLVVEEEEADVIIPLLVTGKEGDEDADFVSSARLSLAVPVLIAMDDVTTTASKSLRSILGCYASTKPTLRMDASHNIARNTSPRQHLMIPHDQLLK
jgi:hypothetical protein